MYVMGRAGTPGRQGCHFRDNTRGEFGLNGVLGKVKIRYISVTKSGFQIISCGIFDMRVFYDYIRFI